MVRVFLIQKELKPAFCQTISDARLIRGNTGLGKKAGISNYRPIPPHIYFTKDQNLNAWKEYADLSKYLQIALWQSAFNYWPIFLHFARKVYEHVQNGRLMETNMGKLTKEKIAEIRTKFNERKSYMEVAEELGINWKTVKAHVQEGTDISADKQLQVTTSQTDVNEAINNSNQERANTVQNERLTGQGNRAPEHKKSPFAKALQL